MNIREQFGKRHTDVPISEDQYHEESESGCLDMPGQKKVAL